ncbi:hypothetical protein [Leptodesmis sp.]|uniref:hypothetical protein n=1 Tax=Leptodesmis sp. TaxID=3100501 RepID=UPI00405353D8
MISQKDQIQALIAEIDSVLQKTNPRLLWRASGEATQQRQVLERVRNYLVSLQQPMIAPASPDPGAAILSQDLYYQPSQEPTRSPAFEPPSPASDTTQQLLERVLQEISQLRASLTSPNQHPASAELIQVSMNRLQEHLTQQIAQALSPTGGHPFPPRSDYMLGTGMPPSALSTTQYEQFQALRRRSDQMLVNLDATLNIVFESLQRNIQTYQDSLAQGLERMHSLGQQSEMTFKALVEMLAQQLRQEVSAYLPSTAEISRSHPTSITGTNPTSQPPTPATPPTSKTEIAPESVSSPPVSPVASSAPSPSFVPNFPYAGTEILTADRSYPEGTVSATPAVELPPLPADSAANAEIAAWLDFARSQEQPPQAAATQQEPTLPTLDLSDLELAPATSLHPASQEATEHPAAVAQHEEESTEIDAALKLLENLSTELHTAFPSLAVADAEAQLDAMLGSTSLTGEDVALPEIPADARDELDEFYQSLFGASQGGGAEIEPTPETQSEPAPKATLSSIAPTVAKPPSASEELFLENLFGEAPTLPPIQLPDNLLDDLTDLEASPNRPDLVIPSPPAVDQEAVLFSASDQISSLADLFSDVQTEQEHSTPVEPPIAPPPSTSAGNDRAIAVPVEQTYSELSQSDAPTPPQLFSPEKHEFEGAPDPLEDALEEQYTRAAFDENLLPDAPTDAVAPNLELDELTLSSLNEDLVNLENFSHEFGSADVHQESAIAQPRDLPLSSPPAFTLNKFAADLAPTIPPAASSSPSSTPEIPAEDYTSPFTLEGMDDIFEDVNPISPSTASPAIGSRNPPIKEIPPFQPSSVVQKPEVGNVPPFQLERLDSLFIEAENLFVAESSTPETASTDISEQNLDEAFESLMGPIAAPDATEVPPATPPSDFEKKSAN